MKDICHPSGCYACHLQDTNYCPYEADFPHLQVFLISVAISLVICSPLIIFAIFF